MGMNVETARYELGELLAGKGVIGSYRVFVEILHPWEIDELVQALGTTDGERAEVLELVDVLQDSILDELTRRRRP